MATVTAAVLDKAENAGRCNRNGENDGVVLQIRESVKWNLNYIKNQLIYYLISDKKKIEITNRYEYWSIGIVRHDCSLLQEIFTNVYNIS